MSQVSEINAILDGLGEGASFDQVELALRDYEQSMVLTVLADRSLAAGGGGGGSLPDPIEQAVTIEPPTDAVGLVIVPGDSDAFRVSTDPDNVSGTIAFSVGLAGGVGISPKSVYAYPLYIQPFPDTLRPALDITDSDGNDTFVIGPAGEVFAYALPTSDPAEAGQLWNDAGTLKVSAGA